MDAAVSLDEALAHIPDGARIVAAPGCAAPTTLLAGLGGLARTRPGLHLYSGLQLDDQPFLPAVEHGDLAYSTWHATGPSRPLIADGRAAFLPLRLSDVPAAIRRLQIDVAMLRVSRPDRDGRVSLGPSMSYSQAALDVADVVLGEIDPALPRTTGPTRVPVDRFTAMVASERPTPSYRSARPDERARRIAANLLELVPAAPTFQLGIGQVPEALAESLLERRATGLRFIGLGVERLVDIAESGLLADRVGPTPPVAVAELMGGERLMRFADDHPDIGVYPSEQAHDPGWLSARFDRLVSVNSAVEVDLLGQVNSEMVDGRQLSGVGGSADFVDAARASHGGLSAIALTASARDGAVSRIVARLGSGAVTTIPRHAIHLVVTEHGAADLRGLDVRQRAEALIAIADEPHRGWLRAQLDGVDAYDAVGHESSDPSDGGSSRR